MRIESSPVPAPQDPNNRRTNKSADSEDSVKKSSETESFSGPSTGSLINKATDLDATRPELINQMKSELESGNFFTEERIQKTIEKLSNLL